MNHVHLLSAVYPTISATEGTGYLDGPGLRTIFFSMPSRLSIFSDAREEKATPRPILDLLQADGVRFLLPSPSQPCSERALSLSTCLVTILWLGYLLIMSINFLLYHLAIFPIFMSHSLREEPEIVGTSGELADLVNISLKEFLFVLHSHCSLITRSIELVRQREV